MDMKELERDETVGAPSKDPPTEVHIASFDHYSLTRYHLH